MTDPTRIQPRGRWADDPEPIHGWFELSYADYLVLPRSVLQSMPQPWQAKFCALLDEMHDAFGHLSWPHYEVRALARGRAFITPYIECETCNGKGVTYDGPDSDPEDCTVCDTSGELEDPEGPRYETAEEVGFKDDPIPGYDRGRTKLEPRPR